MTGPVPLTRVVVDHKIMGGVVAACRSQSDAEFGFRQLKDHVVSFSPIHHWTDHADLHLSVRELLDHLAGI